MNGWWAVNRDKNTHRFSESQDQGGCGGLDHLRRRSILRAGATGLLGGATWLTAAAERLARADEPLMQGLGATSVILIWLQGGPSQLETFDPHPNTEFAYGTKAIKTTQPDVQLAVGMEPIAEIMKDLSIVRSVTSKEGDHARAVYNVKTGYRPDPTLIHPSLGAIACYHLNDNVEIPRHVSIRPSAWPARGGYLGDQLDAFKINNLTRRIPDITARVPEERMQRRVDDLLNVVEGEFARGRLTNLEKNKTLHRTSIQAALKMMSSDQLAAFDISEAPQSVRDDFGDTQLGRGCLAAAQLTEVGVRCVEITHNGWDTHIDNHAGCQTQIATMAPAVAALIRYLKERDRLKNTLVVCGGEFGRTPKMNPTGGRDHWPYGFSIAMAGGGIRGGRVVGETSPEPQLEKERWIENVIDPHPIQDIHATVLRCLGIDGTYIMDTPIGRPLPISEGTPIAKLLEA